MSTASTYDIGDRFRVTATFTDTGGSVTDPATVRFFYLAPNAASAVGSTYSVATTEIIRASTGVYYSEIVSTGAGYYAWRWSSTGDVVASTEGKTYIRRQLVSS